jgi:hypothetical protein
MTRRRAKKARKNFTLGPPAEEAIFVRSGDTLIVRVREDISLAEIDAAEKTFGKQLPQVRIVVIPASGQILVYRPSADPPPERQDSESSSTTKVWYF